jgi:hypothetical protein
MAANFRLGCLGKGDPGAACLHRLQYLVLGRGLLAAQAVQFELQVFQFFGRRDLAAEQRFVRLGGLCFDRRQFEFRVFLFGKGFVRRCSQRVGLGFFGVVGSRQRRAIVECGERCSGAQDLVVH